MKTTTKGYKVTNSKMQCLNFQFELDKAFTQSGELEICKNGFHFCQKLSHCFNYYSFDKNNRVFEIQTDSDIITENDKSCTLSITFLRELTWQEVLVLANEGADNTGHSNTGDRNTGYSNTGDRNTGAFCTKDAPFPMFNKKSAWTEKDFQNSKAYALMQKQVDTKMWVPERNMTDAEKEAYPSYKTAEGFLKDIPFKEAFQNACHNWSATNKAAFTSLPNFNAKIFEEITGVKI